MAKRAYSYRRFSTPDQQRGDSFRRQTAAAEAYARTHGLTLDTELTFDDLGVSAYRGKNSETGRLGDFLRAIQDGVVPAGSVLLVESLDRISRQTARKAVRVLEDIADAGVGVVTLNDGREYTKEALDRDPIAFLLAILTFIRANEESETKGRRLSAVWSNKRSTAADRPMTSTCPAWLRLDVSAGKFEVIEERAAVVRRIFTETLAGAGAHSIVRRLNEQGVPVFGEGKRQGTQWHRSYVMKLLGFAAVVGTLVPHRMVHEDGKRRREPLAPVEGYYPAVITEETFERVQAMKDETPHPLRGRHATSTIANVLGGLARCPKCGGTMSLVTKSAIWRYLVCSAAKTGAGCTYHSVRYTDVESSIVVRAAQMVAEATTGTAEGDALQAQLESAHASLRDLEDQLEALLDTAGQRGRASPALADRIIEREEQLRATRAGIERLQSLVWATTLPSRAARIDDLVAAAEAQPLDRAALNAALRTLMTGVTVDYPNGRLVFHWRGGGMTEMVFAWPTEEV